jgi:hypothetical protein
MQPTLGLIDEPPAPEDAPAPALGTSSEEIRVFGPEISPGLPAFRSVVLSVLFHGLVIAALMTLRFPVSMPPQPEQQALSPTEIRIGQHVYYVARIPPPEAPKEPAAKRTQAPQRKAAAAPALALRNPKLVAPAPAAPAPRALPRAFIPPEVRQSAAARQTLIQPLSPPDLVPPVTPLPNFRILSTQIPKIAKPFLAPGRPKPPPQVPVLALPAPMEMVHADPQPTNLRARLPLPRTPPPLDAPPAFDAPDLPPPTPVGDPVNILSLNDRNIPMTDRLVVPPGNIAQISGEGAGAGGAVGSPAGETNPRANGTSSNNPSVSNGLGSSSAAASSSASGLPAGSAQGTASGSGTTTIASSASLGSGSAVTGSAGPGAPGGVAGGISITGGNRPGIAGAAPLPTVIRRPANGNFDAMVVQTTPLNQYPESRSLLTGRPIYSVYFSVGTAADWTFYFCIPGEKPASSNTSVIQLGPPATPVKAPYPTKLVRPEITLPSWEKYVLVHGYVNEEGRFEGLRVVRSIQPGTDQALLASLSGWEFRAATKDGVGVMIEFLLSIPAKGL